MNRKLSISLTQNILVFYISHILHLLQVKLHTDHAKLYGRLLVMRAKRLSVRGDAYYVNMHYHTHTFRILHQYCWW